MVRVVGVEVVLLDCRWHQARKLGVVEVGLGFGGVSEVGEVDEREIEMVVVLLVLLLVVVIVVGELDVGGVVR